MNQQLGQLTINYYVDAILKTDFADVRKRVLAIGEAVQSVKSNKKKYLLMQKNKEDYAVFEFSKTRLFLTYYTNNITVSSKSVSLLEFIKMLIRLRDSYDIKADALYEHIAEVISASYLISKNKDNNDKQFEEKRLDVLSNSNSILSIELRRLDSLKVKTEQELATYRKFCVELLKKLAKDNESLPVVLRALEVNEILTSEVLALIKTD